MWQAQQVQPEARLRARQALLRQAPESARVLEASEQRRRAQRLRAQPAEQLEPQAASEQQARARQRQEPEQEAQRVEPEVWERPAREQVLRVLRRPSTADEPSRLRPVR